MYTMYTTYTHKGSPHTHTHARTQIIQTGTDGHAEDEKASASHILTITCLAKLIRQATSSDICNIYTFTVMRQITTVTFSV